MIRLTEALEQEENTEAVEQFQSTLDEESKLIEDTVGKISQLKIMKGNREKVQGSRGLRELIQGVTRVQKQMNRLQSVQPPTN